MEIIDWVRKWYNEPSSELTPKNDRMFVFMAAVALLYVRPESREHTREIRDYLEYLLLGCNPITNWKKESEFEVDPDCDFYKKCVEEVREPIVKLLDFTAYDNGSSMYPILVRMLKACEQYGSQNVNLAIGERMTMLMLSLYLLDRRLTRPTNDVGLIQSCLDLWYSSEKLATDNDAVYEYASMRHDLRYSSWISKNICRLFKMHLATPEIKSNLSYIGWFASLVRSYRMAMSLKKDDQTFDSGIRVLVTDEIEALKNARYLSDIKHHEDRTYDQSGKLFRLFRIKPPPVKIR